MVHGATFELSGYNVHRSSDTQQMLEVIGVKSIDELFEDIPLGIRLARPLNLPEPMTEWQLQREMSRLASSNATVRTHLSFLGGGAYAHHIPAVVDYMCNRGEFLTAYTPYQPEMSQGLLQVLFEYQLSVSKLVGLPSVNCSLYDGATALAEAAWMACSIKDIKRLIVSKTIWPEWLEVLETYMKGRGVDLHYLDDDTTGMVDLAGLQSAAAAPTAAVLIQSPNRYGVIEDIATIASICKERDILTNVAVYPIACGLLKPPGELGADIVTCEGQALGIPLSAGGAYLGVLATHKEYERYLPGRIVGKLVDLRGESAYALIKEEREQHVSRDRATSHICSNQALHAMRAAIYLACVGEVGMREIAAQNTAKAHHLADLLTMIEGVKFFKSGNFFNEFTLTLPVPVELVLERLLEYGIFGGIGLGSHEVLIAVTELHSRADLQLMFDILKQVVVEMQ